MERIQLFKPVYGKEEIEAVERVMSKGWTGLGPETELFEKEFAEATGAPFAVAFNSATSALEGAMAYVHRKYNFDGSVVTSPLTFVSTAHSAKREGFGIKFCDIDPDSLSLDMMEVLAYGRGSNVAAIIPVLYGGNHNTLYYDWQELRVPVVFDCAHCAPLNVRYKYITCCWSFQAVKCISCGDGGMVTTVDPEMSEFLRKWRWCGISKSTYERTTGGYRWDYSVNYMGAKSHMNDIAAAIGRVQLRKVAANHDRRHQMYRIYLELLKDKGLPIQWHYRAPEDSLHIMYLELSKATDRPLLMDYLYGKGIDTGVHYKPLYLHPTYRSRGLMDECPVTDSVWPCLVSLPFHLHLTNEDIEKICVEVHRYFSQRSPHD